MRNAGVKVFQRPLRYRTKEVRLPLTIAARGRASFYLPDKTPLMPGTKLYLPDGREIPDGTYVVVRVAEEKGIDVRLALDVVRLALDGDYDAGVIFSQDQDLAEAAQEVGTIAGQQKRQIDLYSAYPFNGRTGNPAGVNHTKWIKIDEGTYTACLDRRSYHQPSRRPPRH